MTQSKIKKYLSLHEKIDHLEEAQWSLEETINVLKKEMNYLVKTRKDHVYRKSEHLASDFYNAQKIVGTAHRYCSSVLEDTHKELKQLYKEIKVLEQYIKENK
jgi:hypothetical protein